MAQSLTIFFVLAVLCINCITAHWVFTDVDFEMLARENMEDDNLRLSDEEFNTMRMSLAYPGTKWCGPGNTADDYDDLGSSAETDMCCRAHDNCPDILTAGQTKNNLTNNAYYTRLHCDCDEEFRQCLRSANTTTSRQIGTIYFNALGTKCYREDYPVLGCDRRGGWFNKKCLEPKYDTSGEMYYQWFDVPNF